MSPHTLSSSTHSPLLPLFLIKTTGSFPLLLFRISLHSTCVQHAYTHRRSSRAFAAAAAMAAMNSSVLACSYALAGSSPSDAANWKVVSMQPVAAGAKQISPCIRAQQGKVQSDEGEKEGRRAAMLCLAAALFTTAAVSSSYANAGVIEDYLEKSQANKELNDKKRLATSNANFARAYTVEFGTCKFPENFTGCQDLAKKGKVKFLSDDIEVECEGKDKYKCGSNVFWKW